MNPQVDTGVTWQRGGLSARWPSTTIPIAHLGCKILGRLLSSHKGAEKIAVREMFAKLPKGWDSLRDGNQRMADAIAKALKLANAKCSDECRLRGAVLWDTMRKGSDYWRPGKLLTEVAELLRQHEHEVSYQREDALCPPLNLLREFVSNPATPFGDYAQKYAQHLQIPGVLEAAAWGAVVNLASGRLPVFYCTDPYVPDYCQQSEVLSGTPYDRRSWRPSFLPESELPQQIDASS